MEAHWEGLRQMLALELFLAEHGVYPAALEMLVPEFLPSLPLDPYSGAPFQYRLLDREADEHGRGYLLYSVGYDGEDHGGRVHEEGGFRGGMQRGAGFDVVINAPMSRER